MSIGLLGGVGLPFFNQLSSELLILLLIIFGTASVSIIFLRETKHDFALKNLYTELFPEDISNNFEIQRKRRTGAELSPTHNRSAVHNDLEKGKHDL